jgi:hypothetical protein
MLNSGSGADDREQLIPGNARANEVTKKVSLELNTTHQDRGKEASPAGSQSGKMVLLGSDI